MMKRCLTLSLAFAAASVLLPAQGNAARKFIAFMSAPKTAPLLKAKGLEVHP